MPVEIWDLPVAGQELQRWRHDDSFPARVAEAVQCVCEQPPAHWSAAARAAIVAIRRVHLLGGAAELRFAAELQDCGFGAELDPDPLYGAARAGLARRPGVDLCADVGQTSIKLCDATRAWRIERDWARAPFRDDVPPAERARARESTLEFIAEALRSGGDPRRVLVALPCEIDEAGRPRGCSYCWDDPDLAWVHDVALAIGAELELVNDAELAALAAARTAEPPALVLTLGFGVGAALLLAGEP